MATTDHKIRLTAVDKSKSAFRSLNMSLRRIRGAVFSFKTALVGAFGAAGVGFAIKQSLEATDRLAKTANRIGTTTEALSKLQFAGKLAGVETRTLNMALQRFVRRTAEVAKGTGEARGAISELGLDANKLIKMPLDQRMLVLADAFANVENASQQVALSFKIFDSEGTAVLQMLKLGSDAMRDLFQQAEMLGAVMSADAAQGVQDANDSITKMSALLTGLRDQFVAALSPSIKKVVDLLRQGLVAAIDEAGGSIREFSEFFAKQFLLGLADVIDGFADLIDTVEKITNIFISAMNTVERFTGLAITAKVNFSAFREQIESGADSVRGLADSVGEYNTIATQNKDVVGDQTTFFEHLNTALENVKPTALEIQKVFDQSVKKAFDGTTDALADLILETENAGKAFNQMAMSIVRDLLKMQIQKSITVPLFGEIQEALPKAGNLFGGNQASGGPVMKGKRYLVGERGPEMFVPNQSGQIVSNDNMGGSPMNVTLNISTGVSQTVRAEVMNMLPQIANATKAAVAQERQRGGSFSAAMGT